MADGFTLDIDEDLARLIEKRASETGLSREALARDAIAQHLFRAQDYAWTTDDPHATPPEPIDPTAPTVAWEEVEARLRRRLSERLARKA